MRKLLLGPLLLLVCALVIASCSTGRTPTTTAPTTSRTTAATTTPAPSPTTTTTAPTTTTRPTTGTATTTTTAPTTTGSPSTTPPRPTTSPTTSPGTTTTTPGSKYGGLLRWIQPVGPGTAIGWIAEAAGESLRTMQLSIQTLMVGQLDGSLDPGLVTSYEVNTDPANASVTLHLRRGVKFSDGTDFNAQAVKWNLETTKSGSANIGTTVFWKSFEVIDDYTIKVNFTTWQNRILTFLGLPSSHMVSPTAYTKNGVDWMRTHMVGTGPFLQADYQRDVITKFTRNPNYWEAGKPYLDGFHYIYVTDEMTRLALFKSGGGEVLDLNNNGRIANDLKAEGYTIESQLGGVNVLLPDSMNADSPWSNAKVRQAAEYAIDKAALNTAFGFGWSQAAYQLPSPSTNVYDPNFAGARTYNLNRAKQLLAEAGYPNGFKTKIIARSDVNRDMIVAIQSFFARAGIQADMEFVEIAQYAAYQMGTWKNAVIFGYLFEWPNYNYMLNLWFSMPGAWYPSLKKPDGWREALTASLITREPDKAIIQKLVRTLHDDATVIPINYPAALSALTKNVHDTGIYSRIQNYYWNPQNAWLSK